VAALAVDRDPGRDYRVAFTPDCALARVRSRPTGGPHTGARDKRRASWQEH
jgi:hypothetical protein